MLPFLLHAGSSLGLFLGRRGGCDKSELLIIMGRGTRDEGRRDDGTTGRRDDGTMGRRDDGTKKPMSNVLNMVFV